MTAAAPTWRRRLAAFSVALLCVYLPHGIPLFLDHLARDGGCRAAWLRCFPLLPGLFLGPVLGAQISQDKEWSLPLAIAVSAIAVAALTWLGTRSRAVRVASWCLFGALALANALVLDRLFRM